MLGAFKKHKQEAALSFQGMKKFSERWERLCHLTILSHHDWKELKKKNLKKETKKRKQAVPKSLAYFFHWEFCTGKSRTLLLAATLCRAQSPSQSGVRWQFLYVICNLSQTWKGTVNGACPKGIQSQCIELKWWLAGSFKPWGNGDVNKKRIFLPPSQSYAYTGYFRFFKHRENREEATREMGGKNNQFFRVRTSHPWHLPSCFRSASSVVWTSDLTGPK